MAKARTERLLNLLFVLLNTKHPVTREQLRIRVPGYEGSSDDAFERMFERDKEALRDLNIPVETKPVDLFHDDVLGYRIDRDSWLMPEIEISKEERVFLTLAASAWNTALISNAALRGLDRLVPNDIGDVDTTGYVVGKGRDDLADLVSAITNQLSVSFTYQSVASSKPEVRIVDPWKLLLNSGHWYLIGFDQDRGEPRSFRLDRVLTKPIISNQTILEAPPADLDAQALVQSWQNAERDALSALIHVAPGSASELRLMATTIQNFDSHDELTIPYISDTLIAQAIARNCDVIKKVDPSNLSDAVSRLISGTLEAHLNGK
jgi:proteasome accessory factor B